MKKITFAEDDKAGIILEAHGFTDGTCRQATAPYEALFDEVGERTLKDPACLAREAAELAKAEEQTKVGG